MSGTNINSTTMNGIDIAESISEEEALSLLKPERRAELRERAHETTEKFVEKRFDFCSIINARSGRCTENCKWCAQSAHWKTGCETYGWVGTDACVKAAKEAAANGADTVITACPLCLYNLKKNGGSELPVVYFTELLAEALGVK